MHTETAPPTNTQATNTQATNTQATNHTQAQPGVISRLTWNLFGSPYRP